MARRATKIGTSVLDLDIDDSKFHSKLSGAYKDAQKFTADAGKNLTKAGKAMTGVGESMSKNITLPIVAAGGAAVKFGLDFDTTMRQIVGLAKVPKDQIAGIRDEILKMGTEVGRDPQELAEAFYFVASAGFEADEAMEVLRTSAKAAAAGMGETQDIAKVLGSVINAYGHDNLTAAHAADVLTAAVQDGTAEASEFAAVVGRVTPVAAALGVSFDQVTAAMAGMTNVGLDADEAATSLRQILVSLQKPTVEAEAAMNDLGLSSAGLRQELKEKGLLATLRTLEERFAGNETASAKVFGNIRAMTGVTALLSLDTDQLNKIFGDTADSLGTLDQAYKDTEGPQRDIDRSMAALKATAIEIGEDVLPLVVEVLKEVASKAQGVAKWWRSLDDDTKHLVVQFAAWLAIIGPTLVVVGKLTTGVGSLFKAVEFLAGSKGIPRLVSALKAGRLGFLGLAAAAAAAAFEIRQHFVDTIDHMVLDVLEQLGRKSGHTAAEVHADIQAIADGLGIDVPEAAKRMAEEMARNGQDYDEAVQKMLGETKLAAKGIESAWGMAADAVDGNISAFDRGSATMNATVSGFASGTKQTTQATTAAIDQMTDEQIAAAEKAHEEVLDEFKSLFKDLSALLTKSDFQKQWEDFLEGRNQTFTTKQRRLAIEAELGSKALTEALNSDDPLRRQQAREQVDFLIGQYNLLAPGALAAGELVGPQYQKGIVKNTHLAVESAKAAAELAGLALNQPDEWEGAGLGNIKAYEDGQTAHDAHVAWLARQTAINGARAAANEKPTFRGAGFTAGGGFADGLEDTTPKARRGGFVIGSAGIEGVDSVDWKPSGKKAGSDWARGLEAAKPYAEAAGLSYAEAAARYMRLRSPAEAGPFSEDSAIWGQKLGTRMAVGLRSTIRDIGSVADALAARAANPLAGIAMPAFNTAGLTAPSLAAARAVAGGSQTSITNQWILNVNGEQKVFNNNRDLLNQLDAMGQFGGVGQ